MIDRLFAALFILGICVVSFIGGAALLYFKLPLSSALSDSLDATAAWYKAFTSEDTMSSEDTGGKIFSVIKRNGRDVLATSAINWDRERAYPGYTLISIRYGEEAFLLDMEGNIAHHWKMPYRKAWPNPTHVNIAVRSRLYLETAHVYPNGDLLAQYSSMGDTPYGYGLVKMDKNSNVLWTYDNNTHHSFYIDEQNGEIYILAHSIVKDPVPGFEWLNYPLLADYVVRLSPDGKELDRIPLLEAFHKSGYELMFYRPRVGEDKWDVLHSNSVMKLEPSIAASFPMFKAGQLIISMRGLNAVGVLDPQTRKFVWVYGGDMRWQHDAHFLPNGHILLLDNLGHHDSGKTFSRVIEFDPANLKSAWYYAGSPDEPFHTLAYGRVQRLPNGNTLITESWKSRVFEVAPDKQIVWSYSLKNKRTKVDVENAITTGRRYDASALPFLQDK